MVTQGVLLDVAGTSTFRFNQFRNEAARFQEKWRAYFEPRVLDAATLTDAEYANAPVFDYHDEPSTMMLQRIAPPA